MKKILFRLRESHHDAEHAQQLMNELSVAFLTNRREICAVWDVWASEAYPPIDKLEPPFLLAAYISMILDDSFILVAMPWNHPSDDKLIKSFGDKYIGFFVAQPKCIITEYLKSLDRLDACREILQDIAAETNDLRFYRLQLNEDEEGRLAEINATDKSPLIQELKELFWKSERYCIDHKPNIIRRGFNSAS